MVSTVPLKGLLFDYVYSISKRFYEVQVNLDFRYIRRFCLWCIFLQTLFIALTRCSAERTCLHSGF